MAMGSRDRSLVIWAIPGGKRPILVLEKLFKQSLVDISWCGTTLLAACSRDNSDQPVHLFLFDKGELGEECTSESMVGIH